MIPAVVLSFVSRFKVPLIILAAALVGLYFSYRLGISHERERSANAAMDLIKQRDKIDGKVKSLDDAGLCRALGLEWVRDHCE